MRKGVSQMVAIILLLVMTIAIAGGIYLWINNFIQGTKEEGERELRTRLEIADLQCDENGGNDRFKVTFQNSGSVSIDASKVNVLIYSIAKGKLAYTSPSPYNWAGSKFENPGGLGTKGWFYVGGLWKSGEDYRFKFVFVNSDYSVEKTCTVKNLA